MVKRQPYLLAFPGYTAFPGGKIDAGDSKGESAHPAMSSEHSQALNRELAEELDWSLVDALAAGEIQHISQLGTADAPDFAPVKTSTTFYRITLDKPVQFNVDANEASGGEWLPIAVWQQRYDDGLLLLAPPTLAALRELGSKPDSQQLATLQFSYDSEREVALIEPLPGLRILPVRSNTLPPATHTNCFVLGDEAGKRIAVDPSPADDAELQRLFNTLQPLGIEAIFITHHHGDHNERADVLARMMNLPLRMSTYTDKRLRTAKPEFFEGVAVQHCHDGETQCHWQDKPVQSIAVPGHDEGQMALAPIGENPPWCIVGDLIQGVGTVVIAPPEGNMATYFNTMLAMIARNPTVIVPSHGFAMGGTFRLQATLDHRSAREQDILKRHQDGENEDQILAGLYSDIPEVLLPLARITIQSHVAKLQQEGRWH